MKRSITRWTTTLAASALLALPAAATAATQQPYSPPPQQQPAPQPAQPQPKPQPTEPQPAQPQPAQPQPAQPQPAQPQPTQPQPTDPPATATQQPTATAQPSTPAESPEEHLRQARAAFNDIKMTSIPAKSRSDFAELRRHLAALENPSAAAAANPSPRSSKGAAASASNWGTEVAAIDRLITQLSGGDTAKATPGANTTGATGTAGTTAKGAASSVGVDEATIAKLMEIRTHITAYAAGKSGAASSPRTETMANDTMTAAAQSGNATAAETPRTGNYSTEGQPATTTPQSNSTSPQGAAAVAPNVDTEAAHRSLLAARDALNQLTQLPAAAQLSGDTRTQVQQLISNFNELITNTTDWRSSYTKVSGTLTTLLGPENTDAQATAAQTPAVPTPTTGAAGTPGAVGTAGTATTQLDPAIRAKLVEMKNNLAEFEKASGGMSK